ncbi:MAG TPA: hypothetical protein VHI93_04495 [Candidatus Thermoplasmatota archaeon]|nr:hypothetical protein [Candidatus Thermoplasmatota archaeon]
MHRTVLLGAVALLLAPQAQAALNGDHPYEAALPYQPGLGADAGPFTLLSGSLEAKLSNVAGPYGFFQSGGTRLAGLTRVCFQATCYSSPSGQLALVVADGGSFGLRFPKPSSAEAQADHALALLVDFMGKQELSTFSLGKTLLAPAVEGRVAFTRLPTIPATAAAPNAAGTTPDAGGLVGLDDATRIQVLDGTQVKLGPGAKVPVSFQGQPALGEVRAGLLALPFEAGSTARLRPADPEAAATGLDLDRLEGLFAKLAGPGAGGPAFSLEAFRPVASLLPGMLNGALVTLPAREGGNPAKQFGLVRFGLLDASSDGGGVAVSGAGPVQVKDGEVAHAAPLVGFALLQMPWWSYLLWAAALGLLVARVVVKPPKEHPLDRYRWVGLACTGLLFLLFFWLWDQEVQAVWGVSLLEGGVSGEALLLLAALELGPMFAVLFAVVAPIRVILRSGVLLAGQGRFMGLPGAFAYPFGYVLGAPLLLAYLNVGLRAAAGT